MAQRSELMTCKCESCLKFFHLVMFWLNQEELGEITSLNCFVKASNLHKSLLDVDLAQQLFPLQWLSEVDNSNGAVIKLWFTDPDPHCVCWPRLGLHIVRLKWPQPFPGYNQPSLLVLFRTFYCICTWVTAGWGESSEAIDSQVARQRSLPRLT